MKKMIVENMDTKTQLELLEADVTVVLHPGSIKGAMKEVNDGEKVAPSRDLWQLDPFKLEVIPGLNPRVHTESYRAHIRALADSMKREGFYQDKPLAGYVAQRDGRQVIYIYEGGSRWLAAKLAISEGAEFKKIPVSVSQDGVAMEDILVAMVQGNSGRPLTVYETAIICKRLARCGWTCDEIASRLGFKTKGYAKSLLSLMAAPYELRELVATEAVSATVAIEMIAEHHEKALPILLKAQTVANEAGRTRVTKRYVPGALFTKAVKKSAPELFNTLVEVKSDPAFASLSEETRTKLATLLADLEAKKAETDASAESSEEEAAA
jgi:ParB family chromosome partitioning protein